MPYMGKPFSYGELITGFLCGVLIVGGIFAFTLPGIFWSVAAWLILIFGILTLLDDIFPYGHQPNLGCELGGLTLGTSAVMVSFFIGFLPFLLALGVTLTIIKLVLKFWGKITEIRLKTFKP
jgi:hypothetical protein